METKKIIELPCDGGIKKYEIIGQVKVDGIDYTLLHAIEPGDADLVYATWENRSYLINYKEEYDRIFNLVFPENTILQSDGDYDPEELYKVLDNDKFCNRPYSKEDHGEDMSVISKIIDGWWKPLYLVDQRNQKAYKFMSTSEHLLTVTDDDIDWSSLSGIDEEIVARARRFNAHFPTHIRGFKDGICSVEWQINPDGRYYGDDDGYGMSDDVEISLFSYIDRTGKPLVPFTFAGVMGMKSRSKVIAKLEDEAKKRLNFCK
ncbi:MAG: hypothetical protein IKR25_00180 [Muribaculaceae bacterium]|nr:hypothetical protein [Muribaculaceae bacterium]